MMEGLKKLEVLKMLEGLKMANLFLECLSKEETEAIGKLASMLIDLVESPAYEKAWDALELLREMAKKVKTLTGDAKALEVISTLEKACYSISSFLLMERTFFRQGKLAYPTGGILYPITKEWQMKWLKEKKVIGVEEVKEVILRGLEIEYRIRNAQTLQELKVLSEKMLDEVVYADFPKRKKRTVDLEDFFAGGDEK